MKSIKQEDNIGISHGINSREGRNQNKEKIGGAGDGGQDDEN